MGRTFRRGLLAGLLLLGLGPALPAAEPAPPAPSAREKCPVCGMFVARFPDWTGAVRFRDGAWAYYDGPKDLFAHLFRPARPQPGRALPDAAVVLVKDYYGLAYIDARKAWFVLGSTVLGPMGRELVPFAREADARGFLKDHGGQRVLAFAEVTPQLLKGLE